MDAKKEDDSIMELEHAIGYSGKIINSVYLHPNGRDFIYIAGGCIVICNIDDPHQQAFLRAHDDQITALSISHNGKLLASGQGGDNSDVIIWDFEAKKPKFKLSEHDFIIVCVEFSDDDKLLFSCGNSADKRIFIWDTANGYIVGSCPLMPDPIVCIKWGGFVKDIKGRDTAKYQLATTGNKQLVLWKFDAFKGFFEHEVINTGSTIREYLSLAFSKNKEDYLYAGTASCDFCIFQMKNKVLSTIINFGALGVTSLLIVSSSLLLVGSGNGATATYKVEGSQATPLTKASLTGAVTSLCASSDGIQGIIGTDRGFIYRARFSDLSNILQCENHTEGIQFLNYPPKSSDSFASCSDDGSIRLWDVSEYAVTSRCIAPGGGSPQCLTYNDEVVLSGWQDGRIRMFTIEEGKLIWQIDNAHKGGVTTICLSKNLKFLCSGGAEGDVRVWETRSREMISHLKEHTHKVTKVMLYGDDLHLLTSSRDRALLCWDLKSEKRISAHIQRMGGINSFDLVPGTNIILSTGQDRKITYWDIRESNPIKSLDTNSNQKKGDECFGLAVSHNGKYFATGGSEQVVRLWDVSSGKILSEGRGHSGCINTLAFSNDDRQLVSGGKDGNIFLWNIFG